MLYITNATICAPELLPGADTVLVDGRTVTAVGRATSVPRPAGADVIDASGLTVTPGFIDLQFNGAFGDDFTASPDTIWRVAAQLPRYGVTAFLPTIITSPFSRIAQGQRVVTDGAPAGFAGSAVLGLHLEGPFLNPKRKGAHNPAYLQPPTLQAVRDWSPATGVRLVTLAPELPGALDVITALSRKGIVVSEGHSDATWAQATAGFEAGARYGTHLYNASSAFTHREPALSGALLTDPRAMVGFIADGVHTHEAVVRLVWQAVGATRLTLVTDAMAALGMPAGTHRLGDYDVIVDATSARLEDGTLAGSILSMDQAVRNMIAMTGCSLTDLLPAVTTRPAALLGLTDRGRLAAGSVADIVLLTPDHRVHTTITEGRVTYRVQ